MPEVPLHLVDAFSTVPFSGNPAGVCVLALPAPVDWMLAVSAELNVSETAFVWPTESDSWGIRWFTPTTEVELCGHATLAAAHVLYELGLTETHGELSLRTQSVGTLKVHHTGRHLALDLPVDVVVSSPLPPGLDDALGISPVDVWRGRSDWLYVVDSDEDVRRLTPDFDRLQAVGLERGVIVTAQAPRQAEWDIVSRFFAPSIGIPEDPVTGSAHGTLAVYWLPRLKRSRLIGRQLSQRGGVVHAEAVPGAIRISGPAVTVVRGSITCDGQNWA